MPEHENGTNSKKQLQPKETIYSGYRFRSRLEARYAVFFDALGIPYRYEPEGFDLDGMSYLPDFYLPQVSCWIEIKPKKPTGEEREKAIRLCIALQQAVILYAGDIWNTVDCFIFIPLSFQGSIPQAYVSEAEQQRESEGWISQDEYIGITKQGKFFGIDYRRSYLWYKGTILACPHCHHVQFGIESLNHTKLCPGYTLSTEELAHNTYLSSAFTSARQARFNQQEKQEKTHQTRIPTFPILQEMPSLERVPHPFTLDDFGMKENLVNLFRFSFFQTFHASTPQQEQALATARDFAAHPVGWLIFRDSGLGCGKTHLATALAKKCFAKGMRVLYTVSPDLLDNLRKTFSPSSPDHFDDLLRRVGEVDLLVLDDLGTEYRTTWAIQTLTQLLILRYQANLPTVIVTSKNTYEDTEKRLFSCLPDKKLFGYLSFAGIPDHRLLHRRENFSLLEQAIQHVRPELE